MDRPRESVIRMTHFDACTMRVTLPSFRSNIVGVFQFFTLQTTPESLKTYNREKLVMLHRIHIVNGSTNQFLSKN